MKKFLWSFAIGLVLLTGINNFASADGVSVNLTIKNNGDVVYSGSVDLLPAGNIGINDSNGNPHDTNADSVLSIVNTADAGSGEFNISNLIYYDLFGAFYLKCINVGGNDLCDNWQYKVNDVGPEVGMDSKILSGGENVVLYFGDEGKDSKPEPEPIPEPEPEAPPEPVSSVYSSGGSVGGGHAVFNTICEEGEKFSPTTGQLCTSFVPPSEPNVLPPVPALLDATLEEKPQTILSGTSEKQIKKIKEVEKPVTIVNSKQNTATVINSIPPASPQTETPHKSWWTRFWNTIFSVF